MVTTSHLAKIMKRNTILIGTITGSIFALLFAAFLYLPFCPNWGLTFGYYGEFNRQSSAFEQNDLKITDVGLHKDVSLEGFWITGRTPEGRVFTLDIGDSARIRTPQKEAEGILVFTGGYMKGISMRFDSPFWEGYGKETPKDTETLLSDIDYFLSRFESLQVSPSKLKFEESRDSIRIRYENEKQALLPISPSARRET